MVNDKQSQDNESNGNDKLQAVDHPDKRSGLSGLKDLEGCSNSAVIVTANMIAIGPYSIHPLRPWTLKTLQDP